MNEYIYIEELDLQVAAKLDTGAKTASLSARDIERFKRDGEKISSKHGWSRERRSPRRRQSTARKSRL